MIKTPPPEAISYNIYLRPITVCAMSAKKSFLTQKNNLVQQSRDKNMETNITFSSLSTLHTVVKFP